MNTRQSTLDWPLFAAIFLMLGFGIVLVYSSSFALSQHKYGEADFYLARQSIRAHDVVEVRGPEHPFERDVGGDAA